jgi:hypothetical protein
MKLRRRLVFIAVLGGLLSAGATGQTLLQSADKVPKLVASQGRIYIYRNSNRAPLVQPGVKLNGEVVGSAKPDAVFFVDRNPGDYEVEASKEEKKLNFSLSAGEEKFVRLRITFGLIGGTVVPELVGKETGQSETKDLTLIPSAAKQ